MFASDLSSAEHGEDSPPGERAEAALARVSQKMQRHPDFPALQAAVKKVQRVARDDRAHLRALVDAVLHDPALSHKLLRLTSTAHYRGAGTITSPQRAIAVMGFETVQRMAMGVRLLDGLPGDGPGLLLREDFLRALLAGRLAGELCLEPRKQADAHLVAQFQNLGRMVAAHHLADDALAIRQRVPRNTWPLAEAEQQAAWRHLGLRYTELGAHVARSWGWPEGLRHAMRRGDWPLHASRSGPETLRWLGWLANDLADVLLYTDPGLWADRCERLADQAGPATGHSAAALLGALARVRTKLEHLADTVGLPLSQLRAWHQTDVVQGHGSMAHADPSTPQAPTHPLPHPAAPPLAARPTRQPPPVAAPATWPAAAHWITTLKLRPAPAPAAEPPPARSGGVAAASPPWPPATPQPWRAPAVPDTHTALQGTALLGQAAQQLSQELLGPQARQVVPRRVLRALWQGLHPRRAVLCLPPLDQPMAPWRVAQVLGDPLREDPAHPWLVDPQRGQDLFSRLCAHGSDSVIADAHQPDIARHLPAPYLQGARARHFMVLPLVARGQALGMLYLDRCDGDPFHIAEQDMHLVHVLRNQATLALLA
ncbi:MAG: HDOD domain-containing protein [Rubrivivax sp.]